MELRELIEKLQAIEKQFGNCLVGVTMAGFSVDIKEDLNQEYTIRNTFLFPIQHIFAGGPVIVIRGGGEWPPGLAQGELEKFKVKPV